MPNVQFVKMHGLGNDFVVLELITQTMPLDTEFIKLLGHRNRGIGFDQLLVVESVDPAVADFRYRIFNTDGSEVEQCGNGVRCFARFVHDHQLTSKKSLRVVTKSGICEPQLQDDGSVCVNMGPPRFNPAEIPLLLPRSETKYSIPLGEDCTLGGCAGSRDSVAVSVVNMGNPHAVIDVPSVATAPVQALGSALEMHPLFPQRVNVGFLEVVSRTHVRLRVFERGVGETAACGTGACAAVVSGIRRGLLDARVTVELTGGELEVEWHGGDVLMTGPTAVTFRGSFQLDDFGR